MTVILCFTEIFFPYKKKYIYIYIMMTMQYERSGRKLYGRTRLDGYLTKQLGTYALLFVHIVEYATTFEVF